MIRASDKPARLAAERLISAQENADKHIGPGFSAAYARDKYLMGEIPKKHRARTYGRLKAGWQ